MALIVRLLLLVCLSISFVKTADAGNFIEQIKKREESIQVKRKGFRFVKAKENFPDRINATEPIRVESDVEGTVVTLHDFDSGDPIETCISPCFLHGQMGQKYAVSFYKFGHYPKLRFTKTDRVNPDKTIKIKMGINVIKTRFEHKKCADKVETITDFSREPEPCYRHPAMMPAKAKRSGYCKMAFDLKEKGRPINIRPQECTDPIFEKPSRSAISWWRYIPEISQGTPISSTNIQTKMTFKLYDKDGKPIPE